MSEIRIQQNVPVTQPQTKKADSEKKDDVHPELMLNAPKVNRKPADEILGFLSDSAMVCSEKGCEVKPKKIEVSKYITPDQATRIGESMNAFFGVMEAHVGQAMKEFNLNRASAEDLAMLQFNQQFMEQDDAAIIATGERFIT